MMPPVIRPHKIDVPEGKIRKLKEDLARTVYPQQYKSETTVGDDWDVGVPLSELKELVAYWQNGFDWRKAEQALNEELPQFWTEVDVDGFGMIGVHFVHQKSRVQGAIPLLFCHGWPGSFIEVKKLLPLLCGNESNEDNPVFDVVAPSLPNFGFSDGVDSKLFSLRKYAEAVHKLMLSLGYDKYVTQGGDWGYSITRTLGLLYPDHVMASHINLVLCNPPAPHEHPDLYKRWMSVPLSPREQDAIARTKWFEQDSFGYNLLQSSKPQTISFLLADSPAGLLAWIYEKMHDWSDAYPWTPDEILTWVSVYYFSKAGPAASVQIYHVATRPQIEEGVQAVTTDYLRGHFISGPKLGVAHFPKEIFCVPKVWAETLGDVVLQSEHPDGGHFAAWEKPEAIAKDLWHMFGKSGKCYRICGSERSGY